VRALLGLGFALRRPGGRHDVFAHPDGRLTAIPRHAIIPPGTCRDIARDDPRAIAAYRRAKAS